MRGAAHRDPPASWSDTSFRSSATPIFLMECGRRQFVGKPPIVIVMYCTPSVKGQPFSPTMLLPHELVACCDPRDIGGTRAAAGVGRFARFWPRNCKLLGQVRVFVSREYMRSWKRLAVSCRSRAFGGTKRGVVCRRLYERWVRIGGFFSWKGSSRLSLVLWPSSGPALPFKL